VCRRKRKRKPGHGKSSSLLKNIRRDEMNTLLRLSAESTVDIYLLAESEELIALIKQNKPYTELLEWVNENF
jgi:hypothetical protein